MHHLELYQYSVYIRTLPCHTCIILVVNRNENISLWRSNSDRHTFTYNE